MTFNPEIYLNNLKQTIESYYPLSDQSWKQIESTTHFQTLKKGETLLQNGEIAKNLHFVAKGVLRAFITDQQGNFYNKNLFMENYFAGSKVSLMLQTPSNFTIEALEDSIVININYKKYMELIYQNDDLLYCPFREKLDYRKRTKRSRFSNAECNREIS